MQKEDLSDMVAEHAAKQKVCAVATIDHSINLLSFFFSTLQKRKRPAGDSGGGKATKKLKEFKF